MAMQPAAPITHGSRMDHFYAVDAVNGLTYVGHCEQTSTATGLLNLIHYGVVPTSAIFQKMKEKNQDYGTTVTEIYLHAHTKAATMSLTAEGRVAIHNLDSVLRQIEKQHAPPAAAAHHPPAPGAGHATHAGPSPAPAAGAAPAAPFTLSPVPETPPRPAAPGAGNPAARP